MRHRATKTVAVATAGGIAVLTLGAASAQAAVPSHTVRVSCVTHARVRHVADVTSIWVGNRVFVGVRADGNVNLTWTTLKPGDGPRGRAIRGGRNVNTSFKTNVGAFRVWVYMNGRGGACTAYALTRAHADW